MYKSILLLVYLLVSSQNILGLTILVFTPMFPHPTRNYDMDDIIYLTGKGHTVYVYAKEKGSTKQPEFKQHNLDLVTYYENEPRTDTLLNTVHFDVFLAMNGTTGYKALEIKRSYNLTTTKILTYFRGPDAGVRTKKDPLYYKELLENIDGALPVSNFLVSFIRKLADQDKICNIYLMRNGINLNQFTFKKRNLDEDLSKKIRIISVSRLVPFKGIEYAIKAFNQIAHRYPQVKFIIVGDGSHKENYKQLVKDLNLRKQIIFAGDLTRQEVDKYLSKSDIFIHPSITPENNSLEGGPVAAMEAMAVGLPVISSDHASIPEVVKHEKTGFLAVEKDVAALAVYLEELICNEEKRINFGINGRKRVEKIFDRKNWDNRLYEIIEQVVNFEKSA